VILFLCSQRWGLCLFDLHRDSFLYARFFVFSATTLSTLFHPNSLCTFSFQTSTKPLQHMLFSTSAKHSKNISLFDFDQTKPHHTHI
jgi:hypothetical protein